MRSAVIVLTSVLVAGCGGVVVDPATVSKASTSVTLRGSTPSADGTSSCYTVRSPLITDVVKAHYNPWATVGQRGYLLDGLVQGIDGDIYLVVGVDVTRTQTLWTAQVLGYDNVIALQNLPGTIPTSCIRNIEAGQVGSGNTKTGGGNICDEPPCPPVTTFCFQNPEVTYLQQSCTCQPQSASTVCTQNGYECGASLDNCKNPINCGTCPPRSSCSSNQCSAPPVHCPKGTYPDGNGGCESGLPY